MLFIIIKYYNSHYTFSSIYFIKIFKADVPILSILKLYYHLKLNKHDFKNKILVKIILLSHGTCFISINNSCVYYISTYNYNSNENIIK